MNYELIDDLKQKIDNLKPKIDYWDFDTDSFQYLIDTFFPYILDLDFLQFTSYERYKEHVETNFIPCFSNNKLDEKRNFSDLYPLFCKNCNTISKRKIENELKSIIHDYSITGNTFVDNIKLAYITFIEKYPDAFEYFGDPCNLGLNTRKKIRNIIEEKYYNYLCECQKITLKSFSQSPIETSLINALIQKDIFKDGFNNKSIGASIAPQTAVYENGEMILGFNKTTPDYDLLIPEKLKNEYPFTIIDIYILIRSKPHPGSRPADKVKFTSWKKDLKEYWMMNTKKLAIYADGHEYHERTKQQAQRDRSIDRKLQKLGFIVFRFTGSEIYRNVEKCCDEIISEINTSR